jgi:uncharacterized membrane protein
MDTKNSDERSLVFSYLELRRVIGFLGISLPFILVLGSLLLFQDKALQNSISAYYHTGIGDVLTGTLCVIGFFLLSYKGYHRIDSVVASLACIFAVGTALFPGKLEGAAAQTVEASFTPHTIFASLFFIALIYFALILFTKSDQPKPYPQAKRRRNLVYKICGVAMIACIVIMGIFYLFRTELAFLEPFNPVFWLESLAILSFGVSWITKGEAIAPLNDAS